MQIRTNVPTIIKVVMWVAAAMIIIVVFHLGGPIALRVGQFSPLTGAFIGGSLALGSVLYPRSRRENVEPWIKFEQVGWRLIGLGVVMWGVHYLVGIACLAFGLAWIFFSDRHARWTVTWYRSEEVQRLVTLAAGLMMATLGVLALMGAVATRWQITP